MFSDISDFDAETSVQVFTMELHKHRGRILIILSVCIAPFFVISSWRAINTKPVETVDPYSNVSLSAICCEDLELSNPQVKADDPCVIKRIRKKFLVPPSNQAYNLSEPSVLDPSMGQSKAVLQALGQKLNGFFVECGALDGETRSNTLLMERNLGWTGLLIEGDPSNFAKVIQKRRKAWSAAVCLSLEPYPTSVSFFTQFNLGHVAPAKKKGVNYVDVECYPLYSLLLAVGQTNVDYFSLDVEGAELKILKTIPWDKVRIQTLSVEYVHDKEGKGAIKEFMESVGYDLVTEIKNRLGLANDFIFKKREM